MFFCDTCNPLESQKLPLVVVSSLQIAPKGSFKTCKDGRIEFKEGWEEFLSEKDLSVSNAVLITFRHSAFEEFKMIMIINKIYELLQFSQEAVRTCYPFCTL